MHLLRILNVYLLFRMTTYLLGESGNNKEKTIDNLLEDVPGAKEQKLMLSETEMFLAEIIAHIFLIQDSNSHPVFRLDTEGATNQVGLETIGMLCI